MPTLLLPDPSHEEVMAAARAMLAAANKRCRYRTVAWSEPLAVACEAAAESDLGGVYQDDGGSVANAYDWAATTTAVFLAWSGRPGFGRKVRVTIGRVDARKRPYGRGPGVAAFSGSPEDAVAGWLPIQLLRA